MSAGIGLVVKIAADTKKAVGDINAVNKAIEGTGTETSKSSKLMSGMKGPALAAFAAVGGAAIAAAGAMIDFGKAAWEDKQEADKLAFTLEKIPGITQDMIDANEAWITQTMFATHVMDTELRQAISDLTLATGDLTQAQELATLAADVAVGTDQEYSTVVDQLAKAVGGKTTALQRNMPWLDANKDGTLTLDEAVRGLTDAYGGAAEAAAETDPWTTIQIIWDELKESLGKWILPLFEEFSDWFKDPLNQRKIQEFIDKLGDMSREFGEKLLPALEDFLDWIGSPEGRQSIKDFAAAVQTMADAFVATAQAIEKMVGWYSKIPAPLKGAIGSGAGLTPWGAAPPDAAGVALTAAPAPTARAGVTINFNGLVTDPESTAREVEGVMRRSVWRNARARSMDPAW
jgi:hypothetical protein